MSFLSKTLYVLKMFKKHRFIQEKGKSAKII